MGNAAAMAEQQMAAALDGQGVLIVLSLAVAPVGGHA